MLIAVLQSVAPVTVCVMIDSCWRRINPWKSGKPKSVSFNGEQRLTEHDPITDAPQFLMKSAPLNTGECCDSDLGVIPTSRVGSLHS